MSDVGKQLPVVRSDSWTFMYKVGIDIQEVGLLIGDDAVSLCFGRKPL